MKKFRLLSIISSLLSVVAITFGICFGVLDRPKTIQSVNADIVISNVVYNHAVLPASLTIYDSENTTETTTLSYYSSAYDISLAIVGSPRGADIIDVYKRYFCFGGSIVFYNSNNTDYRFIIDSVGFYNAVQGYYSPVIEDLNIVYDRSFIDSDIIDFKLNFKSDDIYHEIVNRIEYIININGVDYSLLERNFNTVNITSITVFNIGLSLINLNSFLPLVNVNSSYFQGLSVGRNDVLNNPNSYNLYTDNEVESAVNVATYDIINNPNDYDLYSYTQYSSYGVSRYNEGIAYASENDLNFYNFLKTLFHAPVDIFKGAANFSLPLGNGNSLNLLPLMTFLLTIGIALAIVKLFKGGK